MKKLPALTTALLLLVLVVVSATRHSTGSQQTQCATGVVFHDGNQNRQYDSGERLLAGVRVSNGRDIVTTDACGRYRLPVDDDTIIFVIKPRGWRTPLSEQLLPRFYYIHKPQGSPPLEYSGVAPTGSLPDSVDFALIPQVEPQEFKAILFGDPQPRNQQEIDFVAHDVIEELLGTDASFGVTLGDIMFDDLSLFESQARAVALLGIPWYNVIGNHDINTDAKHHRYANETFESQFGPSYYSFDYGSVHFLVLDDIEWLVSKEEESKTESAEKAKKKAGKYRGGLRQRQMEFIRNDLAMIPQNQLVVLMMHIPLIDVNDRHELYRLIEQRPFCLSISGHTHHHEHRFITRKDGWNGPRPHHHIINVTVSGSWWSGTPDERGIPHTTMADGAPNGYSIITFDGHNYKLDFKAAGRPASYQMRIHAPEVVTKEETGRTDVYVNVFNASERSKVEMSLGTGEWIAMNRIEINDPSFELLVEQEKSIKDKPWRSLPKPKVCPHLWTAKLPDHLAVGVHSVQVRTTDMHDRTFVGRRLIRIQDPPPADASNH